MPGYKKINKIDPVYFRRILKCVIGFGLIIVLVTGLFSVYKFKKISKGFISTEAKITHIEFFRQFRSGPGWVSTFYDTTLEFYRGKGDFNPSGYTYVRKDHFGDGRQGNIGEYVPIIYNEKDPNMIYINRFGYLWGYHAFFGSIGLIFMFLGIWIYRSQE